MADDYTVKELQEHDINESFFETLRNLSDTDTLDKAVAKDLLSKIQNQNGHVFIAMKEDGEIIGSATVLIEQKFSHNGGKCAHVEDVVARKGFQGMGIGSALMKALIRKAKDEHCYKVILDCSEQNVPFYEKLGFTKKEVCMRLDIDP